MTQELILQELKACFFEEVAAEKSNTEYWPKWVGTYTLAQRLNTTTSKLRPILNKMEDAGLIHSERGANWCQWAATHIEGFKQHQFKDYYCKA